MSRSLAVFAALAMLHASAGAQPGPAFEVASVRPKSGPAGRVSARGAGRTFELVNESVVGLVARAHRIGEQARVVVPDWARRERFDIRAVMPASATERDVPDMLRTLLVDRFSMKAHVEQRSFPVYELSLANAGPRFPEVPAADDLEMEIAGATRDTTGGLPGDELRTVLRGVGTVTITARTRYEQQILAGGAWELNATRITMPEFINVLRLSTDRPVVDKTGLTGIYQFKVRLPPGNPIPAMQSLLANRQDKDPSGVSLNRSLEELGLKLEPKDSPVDFIVVDRIERPTPD